MANIFPTTDSSYPQVICAEMTQTIRKFNFRIPGSCHHFELVLFCNVFVTSMFEGAMTKFGLIRKDLGLRMEWNGMS